VIFPSTSQEEKSSLISASPIGDHFPGPLPLLLSQKGVGSSFIPKKSPSQGAGIQSHVDSSLFAPTFLFQYYTVHSFPKDPIL